MKEQELKELFKEIQEGPSYGFSTKTMREIRRLKQNKISFSKIRSGSIVGFLVPAALLILLIISLLTTSTYNFELDQQMSINFLDLHLDYTAFSGMGFIAAAAPLLVCAGLWFWILKSKRDLRNHSE